MKIIPFLVIVFVAAIVFNACSHEVEVPATTTTTGGGSGSGGSGGSGSNEVCFEADILPIFKSNCAKSGCHDVASHQEGYIFDSYTNIVKKDVKPGRAEDSKVYKVLIDTDEKDRMPQAPNPRLTTVQINLIKRWINEGAKNTTNCGTGCDTSVFTYSGAVRPILDANCVGCHNSSLTSYNVNLSTYSGVQAVASSGQLLGAITHSSGYFQMPKGSNKLDECKITQIKKWIQSGAQNN